MILTSSTFPPTKINITLNVARAIANKRRKWYLLSDIEFESYRRNHMIKKNKRLLSKGNRKNAKYKQKWCLYITLRKYSVRYDHVIHPILEYKISTQVIISTNILSKYKIKEWSRSRVLWWRWWLCGYLVSDLGWDIGSDGLLSWSHLLSWSYGL